MVSKDSQGRKVPVRGADERDFAHQFDTGGLGRLYVRGKENLHRKFLIQDVAGPGAPDELDGWLGQA